MTFKEFFLPLSNKKIKQLLFGSVILIIFVLIINSNIKDNKNVSIEVTGKKEQIKSKDEITEKPKLRETNLIDNKIVTKTENTAKHFFNF